MTTALLRDLDPETLRSPWSLYARWRAEGPVVELPELGMRLTTGGEAIDLASKVVQIPPVGDVARSENSAVLLDEHGNAVGEIVSSDIEVGEVVCSFPLGNTAPPGQRSEHVHEIGHGHHDPSGPGFFAEPPNDSRAHGGANGHERGGAPQATRRPARETAERAPRRSTAEVGDVLARLERDLGDLLGVLRALPGER